MALVTGLAIAGGLANLYQQHRAGKTAQRADQQYKTQMQQNLQGQREDISSLLEPDAYRDYMQSDMVQSALGTTRDQLRDVSERIKGGVARTGGTVESRVASQGAVNRGYSDTITKLAGTAANYQHDARSRLMYALQNLASRQGQHQGNLHQMGQMHAGRQAQSGQNLGNSFLDLAGAIALPKA